MHSIFTTYSLIKRGRFFFILYWALKLYKLKIKKPPLPTSLTIEPNNTCNLQCPTCPTGNGQLTRDKGIMNLQKFKKIINQVRGYVTKINLYGFGEPFLNPDILLMVHYAATKNITVEISSNCQFIKSENDCTKIVKSGLHGLIISLDGKDQNTIDQFRIGANFDKIIKSIKLLKAAKIKFKSKTPKLELQILIMKHNENQRNKIKLLAQKLGIDIYREKLLGLNTNDSNFQEMAKKLLPKNKNLRRYYRNSDGLFKQRGQCVNQCLTILKSAMILVDGSVIPCCYDWNGQYNMGNIFKTNLRDIWHNSKYKQFRQMILKNKKQIPMCNICPGLRQQITKKTKIKNKKEFISNGERQKTKSTIY